MNQGIRMPDVNVGVLSPDGNFYWDGTQWKAAVSPDGGWRWNGTVWVATLQSFAVPQPPTPYTSPRSLGIWACVLLGISIAVAFIQVFVVDPYVAEALTFGDQQVEYNVSIGGFVVLAMTAALFLAWFNRSSRNLAALGAQETPVHADMGSRLVFYPYRMPVDAVPSCAGDIAQQTQIPLSATALDDLSTQVVSESTVATTSAAF